jgi:predicted DNA-binding transcriptional regulator YafY
VDRLERFYKIDSLLKARRSVSRADLIEALEVSPATLKRDLEFMRDRFNAPIEWNRETRGYQFGEGRDGPKYELPGLWFNSAEAHALIAIQHLIENIEPAVLQEHILPLQERLRTILGYGDYPVEEIRRRVRILGMTSRKADLRHFGIVAAGLLRRRRLRIKYHVRSRDESTQRDVSPQRLVHYRDNWYLDAWCHLRRDVRSFAVDAIQQAELLPTRCKVVPEQDLDAILASGYGIFSGRATTMAKLSFNRERARWVAPESWHPKQVGTLLEDGSYVLEFPYSDDRELIGDILRHGSNVEVLEPASLRARVSEEIRKSSEIYEKAGLKS